MLNFKPACHNKSKTNSFPCFFFGTRKVFSFFNNNGVPNQNALLGKLAKGKDDFQMRRCSETDNAWTCYTYSGPTWPTMLPDVKTTFEKGFDQARGPDHIGFVQGKNAAMCKDDI